MSDYDNTNRFSLWGNTDKKTPTHPDFSGTINVDGKEYFIDGWKRKPDANPKAPALSGSIKLKEKQVQPSGTGGQQFSPSQQAQTPPAKDDLNDDIPF